MIIIYYLIKPYYELHSQYIYFYNIRYFLSYFIENNFSCFFFHWIYVYFSVYLHYTDKSISVVLFCLFLFVFSYQYKNILKTYSDYCRLLIYFKILFLYIYFLKFVRILNTLLLQYLQT